MTMNNAADNLTPVPVLPETPPCPCWAQCVNLHLLPNDVRQQLGLRYKQYYIIVRQRNSPNAQQPGPHVQLLDPKTKELSAWLPASFFIINTAMWPN